MTGGLRLLALLMITVVIGTVVSERQLRLSPPRCGLSGGLASGTDADLARSVPPAAPAPLKGPVGWDTFREIEELPVLPIGTQPGLFSSADPRGGNRDGFHGTYLCRDEAGYVLGEHVGPGELSSLWFTRGDGDVAANGRLRVELDGETVIDARLQDVVDGNLGAPFVWPLVGNADQSSGGVYIQVPMPFRRSMRVITDAVPRFHRVQYRTFADAAGVARFDPSDEATDVVEMLRAAGTRPPTGRHPDSRQERRSRILGPGQGTEPVRLDGPGLISALRMTLPQVQELDTYLGDGPGADPDRVLDGLYLRVSFDGDRTVDVPVGEFFGVGLGERPVRTLLFAVDPVEGYRSWWPMPFARDAEVSLHNTTDASVEVGELQVDWHPDARWAEELGPAGRAGHFHAEHRAGATTPGRDWQMAAIGGHGRVVGFTQTFEGRQPGRTYLEGDERVFIDGARSPQLHGTGTEDLYLGGWYFNRGPFATPFSGHSAHLRGEGGCRHECDAAYRLLLADALAFHGDLQFRIEHGVDNGFPADYGSTVFWYGRGDRALTHTDSVDVGSPRSELANGYVDRGRLRRLTAGPPGHDTPSVVADRLRESRGTIRFQVSLDPDNAGVLLRRRADQAQRGQAARVLVDDVPARTWYQPDGNHARRWLDDDLLLPAALTRGRESVEITLQPLPGAPPWTAARYDTFSLRAPSVAGLSRPVGPVAAGPGRIGRGPGQ